MIQGILSNNLYVPKEKKTSTVFFIGQHILPSNPNRSKFACEKSEFLGLNDVEVQSLSKGFCDEWSFPGRDAQLCFDHT